MRATAVIVPVHNEALVVGGVLESLLQVFPRVIAVDDGSSDESVSVISATGATLVRHPLNLGQGAALQTGVEYALRHTDAQYFVTFDSDGQHAVSDAMDMVRELSKGEVDVVLGSRFLDERSNVPGSKVIALALGRLLMNSLSGLKLTDAHNGLRAFNRRFAEGMHLRESGMGHASEIVTYVAEGGFRYREMPVMITYSEYSRGKGQPLINGVNVLFDVLLKLLGKR